LHASRVLASGARARAAEIARGWSAGRDSARC